MIYIQNDEIDPYYNLALEEFVFKSCKPGDHYFILWRNDNTIVIGKNQNVQKEINESYVREHKINIVRRITGGGSVYHDLGNVNFTFISPVSENAYDFSKFTRPVINALASLGVKAENQGRNDIAINGMKISGNAQRISDGKILHHGTLLFDSDLDVLGKCLNAPPEKLAAKGIASVRSRVTNIKKFCKNVSTEKFMESLKDNILRENGYEKTLELSQNELCEIRKICDEKYKSSEWIYGNFPEGDYEYCARLEGCGSICFSLKTLHGIITECKISGDFFGNSDASKIEQLLRGIKNEGPEIARALNDIEIENYFAGTEKFGKENFFKSFNWIPA